MFITGENLGKAIATFIDNELLTKASGFQKVLTAMVGITIAKQGETVVTQYKDILTMLGIVNEEEFIDLDIARKLVVEAFNKTGKITAFGIIFSEDDVNTLYEIAKRYAE